MSASTIYRAANDAELIARVTALAHKVRMSDPAKADTNFGRALATPPSFMTAPSPVTQIMFPIAVDTEAAYEAALLNMRGAPGHDVDIITDAALEASVVANWPPDPPPTLP